MSTFIWLILITLMIASAARAIHIAFPPKEHDHDH